MAYKTCSSFFQDRRKEGDQYRPRCPSVNEDEGGSGAKSYFTMERKRGSQEKKRPKEEEEEKSEQENKEVKDGRTRRKEDKNNRLP